jgi:hypothetical protein
MLTVLSLLLTWFLGPLLALAGAQPVGLRTDEKDLSMQREENPPMVVLTRTPPEPEVNPEDFEVRDGFTLVDSLDAFRRALHRDDQKIRLKPGVYTAESTHGKIKGKNSIFGVTGSNNHFDLRGAVIETPASVMKTLPKKVHVPQSWVITGDGNTFEGGYFRNVLDEKFPFHSSQNEFEVRADDTTLRGGTFVVKGSFPYGHTDFYGKGSGRWTSLNKHSFMAVSDVENFRLINADLYHQSFGHGVHFHGTKEGLIKGCNLYGTVRPTNDIIEPGKAVPKGLGDFTENNVYSPPGRYETAGPAAKHDYQIKYRGSRPIPPNEMIPLTEDGVRSYNNVEDITVKNTYIERFRHCLTLNGPGDYLYENVTVREAGNIAFQTASSEGDVVVRNSFSDVAYSPLLDLTTRAPVPNGDFYEFTVLSARDPEAERVFTSTELEAPKCVGSIHGKDTTFVFRDGKTRELPDRFNYIRVAGKGLKDSVIVNLTSAEVRLHEKASGSLIISAGPVTGKNGQNKIQRIRFPDLYDSLLEDVERD